MCITATRFDFVEQSLGLFDIETQTIAAAIPGEPFDEAVGAYCFALEDLIKQCLFLYERVDSLLNHDWSMAEGVDDERISQRLELAMRRWLRAAERVQSLYGFIENEYLARNCDANTIKLLTASINNAAEQIEEWELRREVDALTPTNAELLLLAKKSPPAEEWFANDDLSPTPPQL